MRFRLLSHFITKRSSNDNRSLGVLLHFPYSHNAQGAGIARAEGEEAHLTPHVRSLWASSQDELIY